MKVLNVGFRKHVIISKIRYIIMNPIIILVYLSFYL